MKNIFLIFYILTVCFFFTACDNSNQTQSKDEKKLGKMSYQELGKKADNAIKRGQKVKAKSFLKEMLKRQIMGQKTKVSEMGIIYYLLGQVTQDKANFKKAMPYLKEALKQEKNKKKTNKREIAGYYYLLGRIALTYTANDKAINYLEKAKILLAVQKDKKQDHINTLFYLAIGYHREKNLTKALENIQKATNLSEKINGLKHSSTASCQGIFARILYDFKKRQEAIIMLKKAHNFFLKTKGKNYPMTKKLASLLKKWQNS